MEDLLYIIALTCMKGVGSAITRHLVTEFGSAKAVFEADARLLMNLGNIGNMIVSQRNSYVLMSRANHEVEFIISHGIKPLVYGQKGFPARLLECPDAPALLFFLGNADLDNRHIISIVGTRNATEYGKDNVAKLVHGIKQTIPDALIVSGLALGIDISSHKAALEVGLPTVGIVAHGLDQIYPNAHRMIARQMVEVGGGLLSEYMSGIDPERGNFLARNRIIAGLADATIIVESKDVGGALVTASIAQSYNREVFAFPGRTSDIRSIGCNRLIRQNRAGLITCANDFLEAMGWNSREKKKAVQQSINFEEEKLSPMGRLIIDALTDKGDLRLPQIADAINIFELSELMEELLNLEIDGKIRTCPGGIYQKK